MARYDPALRWKIIAGIASCAVLLLGFLAYNLGNVNQDVRDQRMLDNLNSIGQSVRERLQLCQTRLQERRVDQDKEQVDVDKLRHETDLLGRENELLQQTNEDLTEASDECEEDLAREAEARTVEASANDLIGRLEFENAELRGGLRGINSSKQDRRTALRTRVRVMRLENQQLREQKLHAEKQAALLHMAERRRQELQKADKGLGERSDAARAVRGAVPRHHSDDTRNLLLHKMSYRLEQEGRAQGPKLDDSVEREIEEEDPERPGRRREASAAARGHAARRGGQAEEAARDDRPARHARAPGGRGRAGGSARI
eukprot:TRINITY_DN53400_c0_g1_i1.p2 TRINITY_DN53400_c0_g1~~TRINITY_DN53400_c0_g1_i1.p2  ORF type:complete len:342 (+),score=152.00 TRINITY_DN53400_c0_g1_i1:82-1026(+)